MAFTGNAFCTSAKVGFLTGTYTPLTHTMKIALYTNTATLDATTTAYTVTGEASGGNYVAGGNLLTIAQAPTIGSQTGAATAYISFNNTSWTGAITARGALIYKAGAGGAVCVLDFGADKTSTNTFTVQFPAVTNTSAIIRIS